MTPNQSFQACKRSEKTTSKNEEDSNQNQYRTDTDARVAKKYIKIVITAYHIFKQVEKRQWTNVWLESLKKEEGIFENTVGDNVHIF